MKRLNANFIVAGSIALLLNGFCRAQFDETLRSHREGSLWTSVTNYGMLGSQGGDIYDPEYIDPAPSAQFPGGSSREYLFEASIWIGAIIENPEYPGLFDTLVSVGEDGWWLNIREFTPVDSITRFANQADDELVTSFADTTIIGVTPDPNDNRPHIPLGLRLTAHSYSWADHPDDDFTIIRYTIENILDNDLENVFVGFYYDGDVLHSSEDPYTPEQGAQDDICGFLNSEEAAYIIDNNGQPYDGEFSDLSPIGICGLKLLGASQPSVQLSFNWWISNVISNLDWGPQLSANYGGPFPGGGNGTPGGDAAKYQVLSNGEFDYDQIWSAFDYSSEGWIAPSPNADDLANGFDARFLLSFGPLNISQGDSAYFYIALVAADSLHVDPENYEENLRYATNDSASIMNYLENLDFADFIDNCERASEVYLGLTDIKDGSANGLPENCGIAQNYPNPFNARTKISFDLPQPGHVMLNIFDIGGRKVASLFNQSLPAGTHSVIWNAENFASGVYFCRLQAGDYGDTKKMLLVK